MAAAMARGWRGAAAGMLFSDSGSGRARALAEELGGEVGSNAEIAERADFVVVAVKPAKLDAGGAASCRRRSGSSRSSPRCRWHGCEEAFPDAEVLRVMPNVGVEVRQGVICVAGEAADEVREMLTCSATSSSCPTPTSTRRPRSWAARPPTWRWRSRRWPTPAPRPGSTPSWPASWSSRPPPGPPSCSGLRHPADVRKAVASPGGSTEAGLQALDREGARAAFEAAVAASLERMRG